MPTEIKAVGILAGEGALPVRLVRHCQANDIPVAAVQFDGCEYNNWPDVLTLETRLERVGEIFKFFKKHNVENVVLIGNLQRPSMSSLRPDWKGMKTLGKIAKAMSSGGDDTLLRTLRKEIENEGFVVVGVDHYLQDLTTRAGTLTKISCNKKIDDAIQKAIEHGQEDKGQSILLHVDGAYSFEGRSGTTDLINKEGREGSILVKMAKPQQDPDLDRPTVGLKTVRALHQTGCAGMIIQADSVFMVDKDDMVSYADEHEMFIEAVNV